MIAMLAASTGSRGRAPRARGRLGVERLRERVDGPSLARLCGIVWETELLECLLQFSLESSDDRRNISSIYDVHGNFQDLFANIWIRT